MEKLYSDIVYCSDDYNGDIEAMWKDIATQLRLLMKTGYIATIQDDGKDIIWIKFEHDENKEFWGCARPYWITAEEVELIESERSKDKPVEDCSQINFNK